MRFGKKFYLDDIFFILPSCPDYNQKIENEDQANCHKDWDGFNEVLQGEDGWEINGVWRNNHVTSKWCQVVAETLCLVDGCQVTNLKENTTNSKSLNIWIWQGTTSQKAVGQFHNYINPTLRNSNLQVKVNTATTCQKNVWI